MKLEQVLNFGMSPNPNANISYGEAKALQAFLSNITELGVGQLGVTALTGAPSNMVTTPVSEVDGIIPDTAVLEFQIWLEGVPGNINTHWQNAKAIHSCLTQNPKIEVGLFWFLYQFAGGMFMMGTEFAKQATNAAIVKAWTDVHGLPPAPPADPEAPAPPVIVPTGVVGDWSFVHNVAALGPGSAAYPVGSEVTEPRGTFVRMSDWWLLKEN